MIVNRTQLAEILGVALTTVDARVRRGMPVLEKSGRGGSPSEFETVEVIKWMIEQETLASSPDPEDSPQDSVAEMKRRKLAAETATAELDKAKKEIELAEKIKTVVLIEDAVSIIADAAANLRAQLLNLPRRASPLIVGETDVDVVKDILDREVNELLEELHRDTSEGTEGLNSSD